MEDFLFCFFFLINWFAAWKSKDILCLLRTKMMASSVPYYSMSFIRTANLLVDIIWMFVWKLNEHANQKKKKEKTQNEICRQKNSFFSPWFCRYINLFFFLRNLESNRSLGCCQRYRLHFHSFTKRLLKNMCVFLSTYFFFLFFWNRRLHNSSSTRL